MATIGIMDSGSGGLSVFKEIRRALPGARYVYYSDNLHCPYGDKTQEYILERTRAITDTLIAKGAQAIVIACNTATAAAIAQLRAEYEIPFVGMEPAVKPAALGTGSGVIGVLATAGTLKASKYLKTRGLYEDNVRIVEHVGAGFVELVEEGCLQGPRAEQTVRESLEPLLREGADTVVLGCTHYPFLLPVLQSEAAKLGYPGIRFIDPAPAVARQLCKVLEQRGIPAAEPEGYSAEFMSSGPREPMERILSLPGLSSAAF